MYEKNFVLLADSSSKPALLVHLGRDIVRNSLKVGCIYTVKLQIAACFASRYLITHKEIEGIFY